MSDIFESPDGGGTIYRRLPGSSERELYQDNRTRDGRPLIDHIREDKMWGEIRRMARTDPALQELLERAIVYYNLKKDHE
jgi:hypothetical protein